MRAGGDQTADIVVEPGNGGTPPIVHVTPEVTVKKDKHVRWLVDNRTQEDVVVSLADWQDLSHRPVESAVAAAPNDNQQPPQDNLSRRVPAGRHRQIRGPRSRPPGRARRIGEVFGVSRFQSRRRPDRQASALPTKGGRCSRVFTRQGRSARAWTDAHYFRNPLRTVTFALNSSLSGSSSASSSRSAGDSAAWTSGRSSFFWYCCCGLSRRQ